MMKLKSLASLTALGAFLMIGYGYTTDSTETPIPAKEADKPAEETAEHIEYWENGSVRVKGKLDGTTRVGAWSSFYENGERSELGKYNQGRRVGTWTFWKPDGSFDRIEEFPGAYYTENLGSDLAAAGLVPDDDADWAYLALCATHALNMSRNLPKEKEKFVTLGMEWVNRSLELEEHYWSALIKVKLAEQRDFQEARKAARKALELGLQEKPGFQNTVDYANLNAMLENSGC